MAYFPSYELIFFPFFPWLLSSSKLCSQPQPRLSPCFLEPFFLPRSLQPCTLHCFTHFPHLTLNLGSSKSEARYLLNSTKHTERTCQQPWPLSCPLTLTSEDKAKAVAFLIESDIHCLRDDPWVVLRGCREMDGGLL